MRVRAGVGRGARVRELTKRHTNAFGGLDSGSAVASEGGRMERSVTPSGSGVPSAESRSRTTPSPPRVDWLRPACGVCKKRDTEVCGGGGGGGGSGGVGRG